MSDMIMHQPQIDAGLKIVEQFTSPQKIFWGFLNAPTQSGKTGTYLFTAAELFRRGLIDTLVVFSGNSENLLKAQLESDASIFIERRYDAYLEGAPHFMQRAQRNELKNKIASGFNILFGCQLVKTSADQFSERTLFVYEESHFAQEKTMRPAMFLEKLGISATGASTRPVASSNYVLSVSATGFSEFAACEHENQNKFTVTLQTSPQYYGFANLCEDGNLVGFHDWYNGLDMACSHERSLNRDPKYCIVRLTGNEQEDAARNIARQYGFACKAFNGEKKELENLGKLKIQPQVCTLVIIRHLLRMGHVLEKSHLGFCFESSTTPKMDVLMQGLMGRLTGYYDRSHCIKMYIHHKIIAHADMDRCKQFSRGEKITPNNATNLIRILQRTATRRTHAMNLAIICCTKEQLNDEIAFKGKNVGHLIASVQAAIFSDQFIIRDAGTACDGVRRDEIRKKMDQFANESLEGTTNDFSKFSVHDMLGVLESDVIEVCDGPLTVCRDDQIHIYKVLKSGTQRSFAVGGVCIVMRIPTPFEQAKELSASEEHARALAQCICKPNPNAVFSGELPYTKDATEYELGEADHPEPDKTSDDDIANLYMAIRGAVRDNATRAITTLNFTTDKFENYGDGIFLTSELLAAISTRGEIYKWIKDEFGVKLTCVKQRGPRTKYYIKQNMFKLVEIKW